MSDLLEELELSAREFSANEVCLTRILKQAAQEIRQLQQQLTEAREALEKIGSKSTSPKGVCEECNDTGLVQCGPSCPNSDGRTCVDVDKRMEEGCPPCPTCRDNAFIQEHIGGCPDCQPPKKDPQGEGVCEECGGLWQHTPECKIGIEQQELRQPPKKDPQGGSDG